MLNQYNLQVLLIHNSLIEATFELSDSLVPARTEVPPSGSLSSVDSTRSSSESPSSDNDLKLSVLITFTLKSFEISLISLFSGEDDCELSWDVDTGGSDKHVGWGDGDTGRCVGDTGRCDGETGRGDGDTGRCDGETGRCDGETGRCVGETGRGDGETGRCDGETGRGDGDTDG